ncbi:hypothetical protein ASC84_21965 [Acinetobacter sp. Root1280]|uniref:hypothetical protein n=1 Tax=Acinetobacter sp. Root1280 TaxID=1736444 RepID=UPI0006F36500|nr:hypothetical protein [Acinetobacter sp. Root1280]KQW96058.1 hypothetical protein ASC84_21965 [Acinetobacter sp. Root1280]
MFKANISFKSKKWTCKQCGLLKTTSKWRIKVGSHIFFHISMYNKKFDRVEKTIHGIVSSRQNKYLTIIDTNNNDTYFIDQAEVYLTDSPSLFLYNMYGTCKCDKIE